MKTRGDVADIGPALTHRDRIVKLFLQGYSESEVAQRTQHTLGCVEQYRLKRVMKKGGTHR